MRALTEPVVIRTNGLTKTVPRAEPLVHVPMDKGPPGDPEAAQILSGIMEKCGLFAPKKSFADDRGAKARLRAKLQAMRERMMAAASREEGEGVFAG